MSESLSPQDSQDSNSSLSDPIEEFKEDREEEYKQEVASKPLNFRLKPVMPKDNPQEDGSANLSQAQSKVISTDVSSEAFLASQGVSQDAVISQRQWFKEHIESYRTFIKDYHSETTLFDSTCFRDVEQHTERGIKAVLTEKAKKVVKRLIEYYERSLIIKKMKNEDWREVVLVKRKLWVLNGVLLHDYKIELLKYGLINY